MNTDETDSLTEDGVGRAKIQVPRSKIAEFCRRHHIRRLALFGSVLRDDFSRDSDIDVLVEFEPGARTGLAAIVTGALFVAAIFFRPLAQMIGGGVEMVGGTKYPIIAPALIRQSEPSIYPTRRQFKNSLRQPRTPA